MEQDNKQIVLVIDTKKAPYLISRDELSVVTENNIDIVLMEMDGQNSFRMCSIESKDKEMNLLATSVYKNMRRRGSCLSYGDVFGPVILYDDKADMTMKKWTQIRYFVVEKSNGNSETKTGRDTGREQVYRATGRNWIPHGLEKNER